jgi:hypothetical protein
MRQLRGRAGLVTTCQAAPLGFVEDGIPSQVSIVSNGYKAAVEMANRL